MELTENQIKNQVRELKGENDLKNHVIEWLEERVDEGQSIEDAISELQQHGCISGMVPHLIHYHETVEFFQKYKSEINELLKELLEDTGMSAEELFGDKWDKEDPLIMDRFNQNLLAWFGFEETAFQIGRELEIED